MVVGFGCGRAIRRMSRSLLVEGKQLVEEAACGALGLKKLEACGSLGVKKKQLAALWG